MAVDLLKPVTSTRTRSVNFFNGRLLSGEDLTNEQKTNRAAHNFLGQAIGDGVVYGLEVKLDSQASTQASPVLAVSRGLAVNRNGATLYLENDTQVALSKPPDATNGIDPSTLFQDCKPTEPGTYIAGAGVYLLTMGPASDTDGLAEVMGVSTAQASCNTKYNIQAVQFRLLKLDFTNSELNDLNHLRNLVAYKCFGVDKQSGFIADPFNHALSSYGLMDDLRGQSVLTNCEVPLAVLYWTISLGVVFVDRWAVRRPVFSQSTTNKWAPVALRRRTAEGLAMLMQFQEQIDDMVLFGVGGTPLTSLAVTDYFMFLPAAGLVPINDVGSPLGFNQTKFFASYSSGQPTAIGDADFFRLVHDSYLYPPVDLNAPSMLQLYQAKSNAAAVSTQQANQLYVLYFSRDMLGFVEHDSVVATFTQAWTVYRGLVTKRVFLPNDVSSDAIGARISILSAEQDVMAVASQKAAIAAARTMNYQDALDAFTDLYNVQHDLVVLFQSPIPGVTDLQGRDTFTQTLNAYLETSGPSGLTALKPALQGGNLQQVIAIQNAINTFVGSWTGQGVAIGYIDVQYKSSPRGLKLVPNDPQTFPHIFTVTNFTDRTLTMQLSASISVAHGDWSQSLAFFNPNVQQINSLTLVSNASLDITVAVKVPLSAQIGDPVTLDFTATAAPPNNKTGHAQLTGLSVDSTSGNPVVHSVKFTNVTLPVGDVTNANPSQIFTYGFSVRYAATQPPNVEPFTFTVGIIATGGSWFVDFGGAPVTRTTTPSGELLATTPVTLTSGATDTTVTVRVRAPGARTSQDLTATIFVGIDSTDLSDHASAQPAGSPFTIVLKHA